MKRFQPAVRALCEELRRSDLRRVLAGVALLAPALLLTRATHPDPALVAPEAPDFDTVAVVTDSSGTAESTVFAAWKRKQIERQNAVIAAEFAREFKIPDSLASEIQTAAAEAGIEPRIAFGLVRAESSFRPRVVSPVGAVGLTQLMPATARWLEPGTTRHELMDTRTNLQIGFRYLKQLIEQYDGNERLALTAFNRGPGTVDRLLKRGRNPDNGYADKVLTGKSARHVALMNAKFGRKKSRRS